MHVYLHEHMWTYINTHTHEHMHVQDDSVPASVLKMRLQLHQTYGASKVNLVSPLNLYLKLKFTGVG